MTRSHSAFFQKPPAEAESFNLSKELSILYKQIRGKELTAEEKKYDSEPFHALDVMGEILNGVKYATSFSIIQNLVNSVSSIFTSNLTEHLPALSDYTTAVMASETQQSSACTPLYPQYLFDTRLPRFSGIDVTSSVLMIPFLKKQGLSSLSILTTAFSSLLFQSHYADALSFTTQSGKATLTEIENIHVVSLRGSYREMGSQYGELMQQPMNRTWNILEDFYIRHHQVSFEQMLKRADEFYHRYTYSYQFFLQEMAKSSGLSFAQCKILNAMEMMRSFIQSGKTLGQCAFVTIPPERTESNSTLVGRNYDYSAPFDQCAEDLTVTILNDENTVPTAMIAMPGQIYCPSCVNEQGVFLELNNGMPSGGYYVNTARQSLLINMLTALQNTYEFNQLTVQFNGLESDYSLVVNAASPSQVMSYEFSSTLGMKSFAPPSNQSFASTNYFLNPAWENIPKPSDNTTWKGVTRRNNLLNLSNALPKFNISQFQNLMDKNINQGGAVWESTIYQMIFDTQDLSLYLKINSVQKNWTKIALADFFKASSSSKTEDKLFEFYFIPLSAVGGMIFGCGGLSLMQKLCDKKPREKVAVERASYISMSQQRLFGSAKGKEKEDKGLATVAPCH